MEYVLSQSTAQKLSDLIGDKGGTPALASGASRQRQVCAVRCTTWNTSTKQGTGQVGQIDGSGWTYFGTAGEMLLLSANGENLTPSKRYPAIRYGETGGQTIFVAFASDSLGCGFALDEDGNVVVDVEGLAGDGLTYHTSESGCTLDINPGCHITLSGDKVGVDVLGLVGGGEHGIEAVGEGTCKTLGIKQGCGITLDGEGGITVFAPDVAGAGLESGETPCELAVKVGCGLLIDSETSSVKVDVENLAGDGLTFHVTESGCTLDVNPGCAITLAGDKVNVDVPSLAGTGLKVEGVGSCKKLALDIPSYTVVAGACLGQDGNLMITYLDPTTGETWCVESPPCCGDPFPPAPTPEPCDCLPPSGSGIVTVSGGAWGTPGPLTGDVTTTGSGLATTITDSAVTTAKIADSAVTTAKIADNAVTHAKYQQIASKTVLANSAGSTGNVSAVTGSGVLDFVASTQGNLLVRGVSTWSGLAIGGANTILTSNGTTAAWGYRPLSTRGSAALASNYTITAASGTYVTVPSFSVTVPETGVYWIISNPLLITGGTALNGIYHSLAINGTQNTGTIALGIFIDTNANCQTKNSQHHFLSLTAGDVITMQVMRLFTGTSLLAQIGAESQLVYLRID